MKIIHTADWHLGQDFFQYERFEEHSHFFNQLCKIVKEEKPDALVVSGDVYHTATPSNTTVKFFTDNLLRIHNAYPDMVIVITAGNHDSCARLESTSEVWKLANVKIIGGVTRDSENNLFLLDRNIVEIPGKGFVLAVPHIYSNNFDIFDQLRDAIGERNTDNLPVVLMAHLTVSGSNLTGHDVRITGGIECERLDRFGSFYDYLALGHIHCPQTLKNSQGRARYSGSPIQVNFDESFPHSVSVVEIDAHGIQPVIREAHIERLLNFYTVPDTPQPFDTALQALCDFVSEKSGYVRLNVMVKDFAPSNAESEIHKVVSAKEGIRFCYIRTTRQESVAEACHQQFNTQEIKQTDPFDIASIYYRETYGQEMDQSVANLLSEIIKSVKSSE